MKDKDYQAVRNYCKPLALEWVRLMGCSWDHVQLLWTDSYFDLGADGHPRDCAAYCDADWRYMHATITFSCARIGDHFTGGKPDDPEFIRYLVAHEIGHILLNEMRDYDRAHHERTVGHEDRVVTRMAWAWTRTWDTAFEAGRQAALKEVELKNEVPTAI